jgi:SAM-dependent methyltransferase
MDLAKAHAILRTLELDRSLDETTHFAARAGALEQVAFLQQVAVVRGNEEIERRAALLRERLEGANGRLFRQLRADVRSTGYSPAALRRLLDRQTAYSPRDTGHLHLRYEPLDELLAGVLLADALPAETVEREPEMVHYEPVPASVILELVDRIPFTAEDVFYDLGSGPGRVVVLVHLLTGVRARGVEIEPAYCAYARTATEQLGLAGVESIHADARTVPLDEGTIFFLFTPFWGKILQSVLERLYQVARRREIRIGAYGTCVRRLAEQRWLQQTRAGPDDEYRLAIFESFSGRIVE